MFNDPAFLMYVLEEEGELDTHQGKLNRYAKDIVGMYPYQADDYLASKGLNYEDILYVKQRAGVI